MEHIYCNLKRFDVPTGLGGVNSLADENAWAATIVEGVSQGLAAYRSRAEFTFFLPEAHLLPAVAANKAQGVLGIGCQGVYREDVTPGGNFGAFTTNLPAAAAKALGCQAVLVGHCEERRDKLGVLQAGGAQNPEAVDLLLNQSVRCAQAQGLRVLYCIGETSEQHDNWQAVLAGQLERGLAGADTTAVVIAYEPVWAIGPGKTPPGREYIQQAASFIKSQTGGLPVVYGGGLKTDNAAMLASIKEIDGGLIALTRFAGDIGFYPNEYLEIVNTYLQGE